MEEIWEFIAITSRLLKKLWIEAPLSQRRLGTHERWQHWSNRAEAHPPRIQELPEAGHSKTDPLDGDLTLFSALPKTRFKSMALLPQWIAIFVQSNVLLFGI